MKYAKLLEMLKSMPKERLEDTVTVYINSQEEFYPVEKFVSMDTDVLDNNHMVLVLE